MTKLTIRFCFLALLLLQPVHAEPLLTGSSEGMSFRVDAVAQLNDVVWGMAFVSEHEIIFTLRQGKVGILNTLTGVTHLLDGTPEVYAHGQGGLLDVAVPDDYKAGDWIYFTYSKPLNNSAVTTLARARLQNKQLREWQDVLITRSASDTDFHFGSRIAFDERGHLFFTVGERGVRENAQDLSNHAGAVLRLNRDGSVPPDNPFSDQKNALPEIWSYGHRNPQGIAYDKVHQRLWVIEHGPRGGDEINLIAVGKNYGWPVISYGMEYWGPVPVGEDTAKPGMEQPVKYYVPSIAPGSLLLYSGKAFPQWRGDLFSGALKLQHLNRVAVNDAGKEIKEERLLNELQERLRSLTESPQGWIFVGTDSGKILKISPVTL
jgi:glucose/arabinose dehydrogenase